MTRAGGLVFVAAGLVACGPGYSKLEVEKIQSVAVSVQDQQQRFCAYKPVALRALVTYRDGKQAESRAPGEKQRGRLRTSEFEWSSNHGTVDSAAVLSLPHEPLAWFDEPILVSARVIAKAELVGETTLHPRFDCGGTVDVRGAEGARGGEAEHGGPGEAGPEVHVALAYLETKRSGRLMLVRVQPGGEQPDYYLVDPQSAGAPFVIDARGGAGGRGGQGLSGIDGPAGLDGYDGPGCADGTSGRDGTDGQAGGPGGLGGNGGQGGNGGTVQVHYDARFPELPARIQVLVEGGEAGERGPGGAGGRGGAGGKGGTGVVDDSAAGAADCTGSSGRDGPGGSTGPGGEPGIPGGPGEIRQSAVDVGELFAEELKRGLPILTGAGGE